MGEAGYAELAGHHLAEGIGATRRPDLAQGWYEMALGSGAPALAGSAPERGEMIRKAVFQLNGRSEAPAAALPVLVAPAPVTEVAAPVAPAPQPVVAPPVVAAPVTEAAAQPSGGITAGQAVSFATALPRLMLGN